jgi:hypothetical protein
MAVAKEVVGRRGNQDADGNRSISRPWSVTGATSETDATAAIAAAAPTLVDSLALRGIDVTEKVDGTYDGTANYSTIEPRIPEGGPAPLLEIGQSQFNFEVVVQPVRIVVPLSEQTVYSRTGLSTPTDKAKWLIGQQGDGSAPTGCDVFEPAASFSETHIIDAATMTLSYRNNIMRIVGKLNDATFRSWAAREVLCQGVSGSRRGNDDWEVSFRFQVKEHQTAMTVAGISGVDKEGWQFLWVRYALKKDGAAKMLSNIADHVVIADVLRETDFTGLGIGA